MEERTIDADEILLQNEEYVNVGNKNQELLQQIKNLIPKEYHQLLEELDCSYSSQMAIHGHVLYELGLKDGIQMKNFLKLVV